MNIILYKPFYYDLNKIAKDINFFPDEGIINNAINSFFLEKTPKNFSWLKTLKREYRMGGYPSVLWSLSFPRKEVFKKLKVVSV